MTKGFPLKKTNPRIIGSHENTNGRRDCRLRSFKKKGEPHLKTRRISDLPTMIIEYRVRSGMTQKEFAKKIGMKEQQLQRYESEDFQSISFKNLMKILQAIGLDILIQETPADRQKSAS